MKDADLALIPPLDETPDIDAAVRSGEAVPVSGRPLPDRRSTDDRQHRRTAAPPHLEWSLLASLRDPGFVPVTRGLIVELLREAGFERVTAHSLHAVESASIRRYGGMSVIEAGLRTEVEREPHPDRTL